MSVRPPELPPPRRDSSSDVYMLSIPYYHSHLKSMDQVKKALTPYIQKEGSFLLRNSISKQGYFTISVVHASGIKHFNVEHTSSTFYLKDIHFSALDQLVDYYSRTDVPNKEQIGGVRLRFPVNRPQICPSVYEDLTSLSSANDGAVYLHPKANTGPPMERAAMPQPPIANVKRNHTISSLRRPSEPETSLRKAVTMRRSKTSMGAMDPYYTVIDSLEQDMPHADRIIQIMSESDIDDSQRCDCGLPADKSSLPRGWSVHLSQDVESFGEVYFMSPNRETFWTLPLNICLELDAEQQDFIRDQIYEFEQRTKRIARAKMSLAGESTGLSNLPSQLPADGGYIKPSPPTHLAVPPTRPLSQFPPDVPGFASMDRSSARSSPDVEYMPMNGVKINK